jgi:CBS domain containing-hemolysin-like protein
MTIVVLIFAEVSPKTIAKESPEKFAMFSAPYIHILISVFAPFNLFFKGWKKLLSKVFKSSDERSITEEELLTIIDEAEEGGGINETEGTLIRSAIEFTELEAADILTPRTDVTFISMDMEKEKIAKTFAETGYSRLPVYEGTHDHVVGIIHHKDFHNFIYHTDVMLSEYVKPALFITKAKKIDALLKELQLKKMHIAVVLDEFGGTVGIVTMEDILEELVGEIWDEHDEVIHEIEKIGEKHYLVSGHANVEKFFEMIDYDMETDVFTVSGWVVETIGHLPKKGETYSNSTFEIEIREIDGKRIKKVAIKDIRIIKENDND